MNHNQQQNNFMQDYNQCDQEFQNVPGVGKVCIHCGQGLGYKKEERIKSINKSKN
jgi:hypothetical protein